MTRGRQGPRALADRLLQGQVLAVVRRLLRVLGLHRWLLPAVIGLNILSFVFESVGISLFVPILLSLANPEAGLGAMMTGGGAFVDLLLRIANAFAGPNQTLILVGLAVACILMRSVTSFASSAAFSYVSGQAGHALRLGAYERILGANTEYIDSRPSGMLLNTVATETWRVSGGIRTIAMFVTHACAITVFLTVMLAVSWQMTAIVALGVGVIVLVAQTMTSGVKPIGEQTVRDNTRLAGRILEGFGGLRTIRLFGREDFEARRFAEASETVRKSFLRLELMNALPGPVMNLLFALFLGVLILASQAGGFVELALCLLLLQRMQPHAINIVSARIGLLNLSGALDVVADLMENREATPLTGGTLRPGSPIGDIRFESVEYSYPASSTTAALRGVDLTLPAYSTTALVGASGAGKSTIAALTCRLFDPTEGRILVGGVALPELDLEAWRGCVAVVPQDIHLFNATLRENIAYGRLEADDREIAEAASAAGAMGFIEDLPEGMATVVGERGTRLSGGQRQRIALARALLRDPDLLILDEATNALDNLSAALVRDAIGTGRRDRTVLVIAHRLAGIMSSDNVVVLDAGRIVEQGPPAELVAQGGLFARMVAAENVAA